MILGMGPVVRYELITTARRGRFYLVRVLYLLSLLILLWNQFQFFASSHPAGATAEQLRNFAEATFIQFAGAQGGAILLIIPALVAGVIADEHQRKTLHYLLASRLSSAEIVLGKLGARLMHIVTFVVLGVPVVCLLALYGGLNPENVYYVYVATFTTTICASGLSILVSIMARRPRDAVLVAYGLETLWIMVSFWLGSFQRFLDGGPLWWVPPVNSAVLATSPVYLWGEATNQIYMWGPRGRQPAWFLGNFVATFYWTVGLQMVIGLTLMALAVIGLRPIRGSSWPGGKPETGWWSRLATRFHGASRGRAAASVTQNTLLRSSRNRPPCGDDPMLWKERHTTLGGGLRWLGSRPVLLFFGVLLGCFVLDIAAPAIDDAVHGRWRPESAMAVSTGLRGSSVLLSVAAVLVVAAAGGVSVTTEREQDTWISLATTLLSPAEVIRAKQLGAVWSARWIGMALVVTWTASLLLMAVHPLAVLAAAVYVGVTVWFVATVGVFSSTFAKNSTRSLVATFLMILVYSVLSDWPLRLWLLFFSFRDLPGLGSPGVDAVYASTAAASFVLSVASPAVIGVLLTLFARRRLSVTWGE
jgi:ABC-type transport system involved in multi-copper enzyme maturation permease subunit